MRWPAGRWTLLIVVCAAVLAATATTTDGAAADPSATRGPGGVGLRLLDAPAGTTDPRAGLYIIDHVVPGTAITRRIEVSNTTAGPLRVEVYPAAATISSGSFVGAAGHTANDLSSWIAVNPSDVEVPTDSQVTGTVTITVPLDAAPGEQYGVVWAEVSTAAARSGGVTEVSRVGIRLYLSVGAGGAPAPDITIESITAARTADGDPEVRATVRNTGGRAVDLAGSVSLTDGPGGVRAGPFPISGGTTLEPGDEESVRAVLDAQLPTGPWTAEIVLRSGELERQAHATISFPATGAAPAVDATADAPVRNNALPVTAAVVAGILALSWMVHRNRDLCRRRLASRLQWLGADRPEAMDIDSVPAADAYRQRVLGPFRDTVHAGELAAMVEQSGQCTVEVAAFDEFSGLLGTPEIAAAYDHMIFDTAPPDPDDDVACAFVRRQGDAIGHLPDPLADIPRDTIPLIPYELVGLTALRALTGHGHEPQARPIPPEPTDLPGLDALIADLTATGPGVVMVMGKGGVGKTAVANAIAAGLAAAGIDTHLSSTDPAGRLAPPQGDHLTTSWIDPDAERDRYIAAKLAAAANLDPDQRDLLAEDLRSPRTEELAVFGAFSRLLSRGRREHVVIDTAPTGHTVLLLDQTGAYHRDVMRGTAPAAGRVTTPLMRLQDPAFTRIVIVTLPQTTPVQEASELQDDLRRAGIEPYGCVVNASLAASTTTDAVLRRRAALEHPHIHAVRELTTRAWIIPWETTLTEA